MNVEDIRGEIQIIAEVENDADMHMLEDGLHVAVLKAIAGGAPNAAELAAEALKTREIEFTRWFS